jgi:hypothetical protein
MPGLAVGMFMLSPVVANDYELHACGNPCSPRALHKTLDAFFMNEGFEHVVFEESVWVRPKGGKYGEDIYVSTHVDDCLICCKSTASMSRFKQKLLTRFQGTDEGEVKEYLGGEVIRDRAARTGKMVQAGYAERVCALSECGIAIRYLPLLTLMYA